MVVILAFCRVNRGIHSKTMVAVILKRRRNGIKATRRMLLLISYRIMFMVTAHWEEKVCTRLGESSTVVLNRRQKQNQSLFE